MNRTPRIAVALDAPTRAAIARLSKLTGTPAARIVADALAESGPAFNRVADAIERVQQADAEKAATIKATLTAAEREAKQHALAALSLLDRIAAADEKKSGPAPAVAAKRAPQDRAAAPARRRRRTPPSR